MSDDATGGWFQVPNSLIDDVARKIGPTALVIYIALLRHAGQSGQCIIRQSVLAEETTLARETVNRAMRSLVTAGYVTIETVPDRSASRFTLHLTARRCDAGSQPIPDVVTQDHNGCDAGSQGLCATITTVVTQDHTEEDSSKKTLLKRQEPPPNPRKRREGEGELVQWFETCFWTRYPRKDGKQAALAEITHIAPDAGMREAMLLAIDRARASPQWRKDGGQFIPHAKTWLHQRRWEDEGTTDILPGLGNGIQEIYRQNVERLERRKAERARGSQG